MFTHHVKLNPEQKDIDNVITILITYLIDKPPAETFANISTLVNAMFINYKFGNDQIMAVLTVLEDLAIRRLGEIRNAGGQRG